MAWNQRRRCGRRASSADDVDLGTADVELRRAAGVVDAQTLNPEQIFAVRDALGDVVGVRAYKLVSLIVWRGHVYVLDKGQVA